MFTGIIQKVGKISAIRALHDGFSLGIECESIARTGQRGDSISVDGVCLTINALQNPVFFVDVMQETLRRTHLAHMKVGRSVNLERALLPESLMGGHLVQGHVDGVGIVNSVQQNVNAWDLMVSAESDVLRLLIPRASIAVNGVSLTIVEVFKTAFSISVIPTTFQDTNLGGVRKGDEVNLEVDILARYVNHFLQQFEKRSESTTQITKEFLVNHGF